MGQPRLAAKIYSDALKIAPSRENTPPALEAPIRHARDVVAAEAQALAAYLRERVAVLRAHHSTAPLARFDECLEVYAGTQRVYNEAPMQVKVPRLAANQFIHLRLIPYKPMI